MMKTPGMRTNPIGRSITVVWILVGLISISNTSAFPAGNSMTVRVNDSTWVKGEKVYLKDVSKIDGPSHMIRALGEIYLAYAPSPGKKKKLHGKWIQSKIRSKPWVPGDTKISVEEFVSVGRRSQRVDDETFLEYYKDHIAKRLNCATGDFQIRRFKAIGNRPFPEGDLEIRLTGPGTEEYIGSVSLGAVVYVDGEMERRLNLSGWVDKFENVVCARQALPRHAVMSEKDLCLRKRNVSKLSGPVVKTPGLVIGKRLKHGIQAGTVVKVNSLEAVPVVDRGDRVTIVAESGLLRVTALGVAQDRGAVGDQIRVKNCMGKKEIVAAIVDGSTVRIDF